MEPTTPNLVYHNLGEPNQRTCRACPAVGAPGCSGTRPHRGGRMEASASFVCLVTADPVSAQTSPHRDLIQPMRWTERTTRHSSPGYFTCSKDGALATAVVCYYNYWISINLRVVFSAWREMFMLYNSINYDLNGAWFVQVLLSGFIYIQVTVVSPN